MVSLDIRGVNGVFKWMTTVYVPAALTVSIGSKPLAASEPGRVRPRSIVVTTACAVRGGAVVEEDALAQRDRVGALGLRDRRQRRRELGHDLVSGVVVVEPFADRPEYEAGRGYSGEMRVERIRVGAQRDEERAAVFRVRPRLSGCRG